eukprot:scaffold144160_cov33-Tisochrysis_lutea.AAC.1
MAVAMAMARRTLNKLKMVRAEAEAGLYGTIEAEVRSTTQGDELDELAKTMAIETYNLGEEDVSKLKKQEGSKARALGLVGLSPLTS